VIIIRLKIKGTEKHRRSFRFCCKQCAIGVFCWPKPHSNADWAARQIR